MKRDLGNKMKRQKKKKTTLKMIKRIRRMRHWTQDVYEILEFSFIFKPREKIKS